jgi:hypothetical protein
MSSQSFANGPSLPVQSRFACAVVDGADTAFHTFARRGSGLWNRLGSKGRFSRTINIRTNLWVRFHYRT